VPSLGVPLGPSVRERAALQLVVPPGTKIVHITLLEFERQSFVSDTMWLLPIAVPIAADTSIALPQLLELCRHQLGSQADATQRMAGRRARAAAMRAEAQQRSQAWSEQNWHQKPISSARLYGDLNARLKGRSWALVHAHGRRWREVLEVTGSRTWDRRWARRWCGLRSPGVDRGGLGLQRQRSPLRQRGGRRRLPDDLQRSLDGGAL
jgi:hypothetical protein